MGGGGVKPSFVVKDKRGRYWKLTATRIHASACPICGCEVVSAPGRGRPKVYCSKKCKNQSYKISKARRVMGRGTA